MSYNFPKNCLKFSLLALFLLFLQAARSQSKWSAVDDFLQSKQKELGKDFVVAVWKKGDTLVYKKETGQFNSKTQAPVGFVSQLFTTVLSLRMVDEGKTTLEDKASAYIPEFARYGKNYVSLRTCLSHMTGISQPDKFLPPKNNRTVNRNTLEEEANGYAKKEIRANPTEDFWYGKLGMNLAGRMLEIISKKRFEVLAKQKLFTPLTMRRTAFSTLDGSIIEPANSAMTTADDFMKFVAMLLNDGQYAGTEFLSGEAMRNLRYIHARQDKMKYRPSEMKPFNYALGAWVLEEEGDQAMSIACPGWQGAFTVINWKQGYGFIILPKEKLDDEKTELYLELNSLIASVFNK